MTIAKFFIDEQYLDSVDVVKVYDYVKDRQNPTHEDLIKILKGYDKMTSHSSEDHPEFTLLRETLGKCSYIEIERSWWNGDRVLKSFRLNDVLFKKGSKFCCACAMKYSLEGARKYSKSIINY
jgi:hypothetical protein